MCILRIYIYIYLLSQVGWMALRRRSYRKTAGLLRRILGRGWISKRVRIAMHFERTLSRLAKEFSVIIIENDTKYLAPSAQQTHRKPTQVSEFR